MRKFFISDENKLKASNLIHSILTSEVFFQQMPPYIQLTHLILLRDIGEILYRIRQGEGLERYKNFFENKIEELEVLISELKENRNTKVIDIHGEFLLVQDALLSLMSILYENYQFMRKAVNRTRDFFIYTRKSHYIYFYFTKARREEVLKELKGWQLSQYHNDLIKLQHDQKPNMPFFYENGGSSFSIPYFLAGDFEEVNFGNNETEKEKKESEVRALNFLAVLGFTQDSKETTGYANGFIHHYHANHEKANPASLFFNKSAKIFSDRNCYFRVSNGKITEEQRIDLRQEVAKRLVNELTPPPSNKVQEVKKDFLIYVKENKIFFQFTKERCHQILEALGEWKFSQYYKNLVGKYNLGTLNLEENKELKMPVIDTDGECISFPYFLDQNFDKGVSFGENQTKIERDESTLRCLNFLRELDLPREIPFWMGHGDINDLIDHSIGKYENSYANGFIRHSSSKIKFLNAKPNCLFFNQSAKIFLDTNSCFHVSNGIIREKQISFAKTNDITAIKVDTTRGKKLINAIIKSDIKIDKQIWRGNSDVFVGKWRNRNVVVKEYLIEDGNKYIFKEAAIIAGVESHYVVKLLGVTLEKPFWLVMEQMAGGSLFRLLRNKSQNLSWTVRLWIALKVAMALKDLHQNNILHMDLQSENVLLDEGDNGVLCVKLADFGCSLLKSEDIVSQEALVVSDWRAPELFQEEKKITTAVDIFSFGVMLWQIITLSLPSEQEQPEFFNDLLSIINPRIVAECVDSSQMPEGTAEKLITIVKDCLDDDPEKRPTAAVVAERLDGLFKRFSGFPSLSRTRLTLNPSFQLVMNLLQGSMRDTPDNSSTQGARAIWSAVVKETHEINQKRLSDIKGTILERLKRLGYEKEKAEFIVTQAPRYLKEKGVVVWTFDASQLLNKHEIKESHHPEDLQLPEFFGENKFTKPRFGRLILPGFKNIPKANTSDGNSFMTLLPNDQMLFLPAESSQPASMLCSLGTMELLLAQSDDEWLKYMANRILYNALPENYDPNKNSVIVLIPPQLSASEFEVLFIHNQEHLCSLNELETLREAIHPKIFCLNSNPYSLARKQLINEIQKDDPGQVDRFLKEYPSLALTTAWDARYCLSGTAIKYGAVKVLKYLISNYTDDHRTSPLHAAVLRNEIKAVRMLLDAKIDVNLFRPFFLKSQDSPIFMSPLYAAVHFEMETEIIKCLLEHDADPHQGTLVNKKLISPLQVSLLQGSDLYGLFGKVWADILNRCVSPGQDVSILEAAVQEKSVDAVRILCDTLDFKLPEAMSALALSQILTIRQLINQYLIKKFEKLYNEQVGFNSNSVMRLKLINKEITIFSEIEQHEKDDPLIHTILSQM